MTMPHLMNCDHSDEGWCLGCVKQMHDELERERDEARTAAKTLYVNMQQFQKLVEQMRHEQKEYFRTRSAQTLEESKRLEKAVDKALRELADKQKRMFL